MKIAFCVLKNLSFCGGIEQYTYELGTRLVKRGHDVRVYSMTHYGPLGLPNRDDSQSGRRARVGGMHVIGVPSLPLRPAEKLTASAAAALRLFLDEPVDVIHFHHVSSGWAAWLLRRSGARRVLQSHGLAWRTSQWGRGGSALLRCLEALAIKQCDVLTCVSRAQGDYYQRRYGVSMVHIPTGAEVRSKLAPAELRSGGLGQEQYVLYVGRLSPEKGVHVLIEAFRRLPGQRRLVLAGPVCDRRYGARLGDLARGDDRIVFTGPLRGRLLAELFSNAALYVQPSQLEGLSMALLEAMGYGCCCLVSDIPENLEAIGPAGRSFVCDDADSLLEQLSWLLDRPDEAANLGSLAQKRIAQCHNWDDITCRFERLYQRPALQKAA